MKTLTDPRTFDHLFDVHEFGPVSLRFESRLAPPPAPLVSNVHLVPFVGDRCVVVKVESGEGQGEGDGEGAGAKWAMPGGTLEPDESWTDAARRELMEEAGARVLSITPFGALRGQTQAAAPWRAHLPHPDFFWVIGWSEVTLVGPPLNPPDGERVLAVECVDVETAADLFLASQEAWSADVYRLAAILRANCCEAACG